MKFAGNTIAVPWSRSSILQMMEVWLIFSFLGCTPDREKTLFLFHRASDSHIDFLNTITENDSVNLLVNEYSYMGGGVAIADFNNDGLSDIFLTGNQVSNRLYVNEGKLVFENITQKAGLQSDRWCTGVSVVDINQDGWLDIYVSVAGYVAPPKRRNLLYVNQHNLTFREEAAEYGLDFDGHTTQAVFFDFDSDSDLDVYLLNHEVGGDNPNDIRPISNETDCSSCDRLFRNEGFREGKKTVFTDVTDSANIRAEGLGLGVVVSDLNRDGWPDIYVGNDYLASDKLYINNRNGTFNNVASTSLGHQSYSSMGVDAADIDNDGSADIVSLDMQPESTERKKLMFSFLNNGRYDLERKAGYDIQMMRNMLHLNAGNRSTGEPLFSEIGQLAGISETDWSWSALVSDFDNDGLKDIHITNGMGRDLIHADFVQYRASTINMFTNPLDRQRALQKKLSTMGEIRLNNYFFLNNGGLKFANASDKAGIAVPTISNGAAYGDLDNDGDLDLVINNINDEATLMENQSNVLFPARHFISIELKGKTGNVNGIGATVRAYTADDVIVYEQYPVRGYLSSVDQRLVIGLGDNPADSVTVVWPDQKMQTIRDVPPDTRIFICYDPDDVLKKADDPGSHIFSQIKNGTKPLYRHSDPFFNDYDFQRMLPQKFSQSGPCLASADVNKDGLTDFFLGGGFRQRGEIFLQQNNGSFLSTALGTDPKYEEDTGAEFFDMDNDGDQDLLVASGSNEFEAGSRYYKPRLYANDGKGKFKLSTVLPDHVRTSGQALAISDFDLDNDLDVFIGGRVTPLDYPQEPQSFLLRNDNGKFTDVTTAIAPGLDRIGMVTDAAWLDTDNNGLMDLVVCGEWMTIEIFRNLKGKFTRAPLTDQFSRLYGLWRRLSTCDIDQDGDEDILLGNAGLNRSQIISHERPAFLYSHDLDQNGTKELILCYYFKDTNGKEVLRPAINRNQFVEQLPSLKKRFPDNESYANATVSDILGDNVIRSQAPLKAYELRSGYLKNLGKGEFQFHPFPMEAQAAPVNALVCDDIDGDSVVDLVIAGNEYHQEISEGREDASFGLFLKGRKDGAFSVKPYRESGLLIEGDVRDLEIISLGRNRSRLFLAAVNQDSLKCLVIPSPKR